MQLYLRHHEACCLKSSQWVVTSQQRRFASGAALTDAEWRWCTAARSSVSDAHTGTKLLSGASNGSVWVWGGKRAKQLRSFPRLWNRACLNCWRSSSSVKVNSHAMSSRRLMRSSVSGASSLRCSLFFGLSFYTVSTQQTHTFQFVPK